jgi:hypothetical protein
MHWKHSAWILNLSELPFIWLSPDPVVELGLLGTAIVAEIGHDGYNLDLECSPTPKSWSQSLTNPATIGHVCSIFHKFKGLSGAQFIGSILTN